ncbi:hypothetical protein [Nostoc favosum]|uniref:Uncharacterized protein n=1 Tax=Nostoc favosum CHAB5714 TaxID=2780399 RepID=A0ABS8IG32_9NOSO|nr:hypothetical protein [Nostoc favosum]MCC5603006.1 hypothetical protein [Nostoc favosum CHAB5714]
MTLADSLPLRYRRRTSGDRVKPGDRQSEYSYYCKGDRNSYNLSTLI